MKNRIRDYLSIPRLKGPPSKTLNPPSRQLSPGQYVQATHEVESYVIEHPLLAIGAVFSIGVFLAWMIKRK